jgi:sterigmatocystin 8-O-methyltransferase
MPRSVLSAVLLAVSSCHYWSCLKFADVHRNGATKGLFDYYFTDDGPRGQRFALAMAGKEVIKTLTEDIFPFDSLPHNATVVDVGGSKGHASVRIAEKVPGVTFVVQDDQAIVQAGQDEGVSAEVKDRIQFMPHDFFNAQPVKGADVYLLRFILHDHPDA